MDKVIARAFLRILIDAQTPEEIAARFAEVLDEKGFKDDEVTSIFETGEANAFKRD